MYSKSELDLISKYIVILKVIRVITNKRGLTYDGGFCKKLTNCIWTTLHPNGKNSKGVPVAINKTDGTIECGLNDEHNGQTISEVVQSNKAPKKLIARPANPKTFSTSDEAITAIAPTYKEQLEQIEKGPDGAEQIKSIDAYSQRAFGTINLALRQPNNPLVANDQETKSHIQNITKALDKCETKDDYLVYRGAGLNELISYLKIPSVTELNGALDKDVTKFNGEYFFCSQFMSTSACEKYAFNHKKVQIQIELPKGSKAVWLGKDENDYYRFTNHHENEMLIQRGGWYKIIGMSKGDAGKIIVRCALVYNSTLAELTSEKKE